MRLGTHLGIIAGALALATAPPAWAGDTLCLWISFSSDARAAVLASYATGGPEAVSRGVSTLGPPPALSTCLASPSVEAVRAAGASVHGLALERAAALYIQETLAIPTEKLEAAWNGIPEEIRSSFFAPNPTPETNELAAAAVMGAATEAGWDPSAAGEALPVQLGHFISFISGRALRAAYEGRF